MLDRIIEIWLNAISFAFPLGVTVILIGLVFRLVSWDMKKCDHKWVRYIIKKSENGINYRCVICMNCGKAHIEEPGIITIEEGFFGDGIIDFKKLWAKAETPDTEFEEILKSL